MALTVRMLGTRGVPARHGGFETAVEQIGQELVRRGWRVVVYCQDEPEQTGKTGRPDTYRGMELVRIPERFRGPLGTIWFDAMALRHASEHRDVCLTFGYNTAILNGRLKRRGIPSIINMDGIEWKRERWSPSQRRFLKLNERLAARGADLLIADHPEIRKHLLSVADDDKLHTIAYGAAAVTSADPAHLAPYGVEPGRYVTVVARPVPENNILEVVRAFSQRPRGIKMLVLGDYTQGDYQRSVREAAGDEVVFAGPVYEAPQLSSLRLHSLAYVHGHTVGGTNPSLVEALGCGNPVIAHDNKYNRWVADDAAVYFADEAGFDLALSRLLDSPAMVERLSRRARTRHAAAFGWDGITDSYEDLLLSLVPEQDAAIRYAARAEDARVARTQVRAS